MSLCLLTWNEVEGCKLDLPLIPKIFDRIYAIDNASTDGTKEYLEKNGVEVFQQITKTYNGAYSDAIQMSGKSAVVFFHPKGTIEPESLSTVLEKIRDGADFVLASRISKGAQNEEDTKLIKPRKWFVIMVAIISKLKWGLRKKTYLDDPLHGYRGLSHSYIQTLNLKSSGITADVEMIRHAYLGDFKLGVIPVKEIKRQAGDTHFPAIQTGQKIIKYLLWSK